MILVLLFLTTKKQKPTTKTNGNTINTFFSDFKWCFLNV